MPRSPWIGISVDWIARGQQPYSLPRAYVDGVRAAGGRPVLLPGGDRDAAELVDRLDGVLLSGGRDVDPRLHGGSAHPSLDLAGDERDGFEIEVARLALAGDVPLLAICRGLQVLNVACGGDLHVDLPEAIGERVAHRGADKSPLRHDAAIEPASRLADVLGTSTLSVVSQHHQAAKRIGRELRAVAHAEDGVVEALEVADRRFCLAVQWHPEMALEEPLHRRLFEALVAACR